jgi:TATA-box binding protein (TBP) (component of TFIID and TFIIIB)
MAAVDDEDGEAVPPPVKLVNLVATVSTGLDAINLQRVARRINTRLDFLWSHLKQRRVRVDGKGNALCLRFVDGNTPSCLIFRNGTLVLAGAKSEKAARTGAELIAALLRRCAYTSATVQGFRIQNMVYAADAGFLVDLARMAEEFGREDGKPGAFAWTPAKFPGAVMMLPEAAWLALAGGLSGASAMQFGVLMQTARINASRHRCIGPRLILFRSGRVLLCGTRNPATIPTIWPWIWSYVCVPFRDSAASIE